MPARALASGHWPYDRALIWTRNPCSPGTGWIALALPLRHADLVIVILSWVFVVTCFANAGILVTSNDERQRSLAWLAGVLVLFAMWIYFALKILLLI